MKSYEIVAEYGPVAVDHIRFTVEAKDEAAAKIKAIRYIKTNYWHLWDRIGVHNMYIRMKE